MVSDQTNNMYRLEKYNLWFGHAGTNMLATSSWFFCVRNCPRSGSLNLIAGNIGPKD